MSQRQNFLSLIYVRTELFASPTSYRRIAPALGREHRIRQHKRAHSELKPTRTRWATYERWIADCEAGEEVLDAHLLMATAQLLKWL
jgi:hypothetical protein